MEEKVEVPRLSHEEMRRLWTKGKVALIWERKMKRPMPHDLVGKLIRDEWTPPASIVSTEELVKALVADPYKPAKIRMPRASR